MDRVSKLMTYPGGRIPAIGDSPREANSAAAAKRARAVQVEPAFAWFREAGYAVARGHHDGVAFQWVMTASSLTETHKHPDHLSMVLFFDGLEWLVDPSYYSHQYDEPVTQYLRGDAAHNALVVKGARYSIEPSLAELSARQAGSEFWVVGEHRAYSERRIKRWVHGRLDELRLEVQDECATEVSSECELRLHFGETVEVERRDAGAVVLRSALSKYRLRISSSSLGVPRLQRGSTADGDFGGLASNGFRQVTPITSLGWAVSPNRAVTWLVEAER